MSAQVDELAPNAPRPKMDWYGPAYCWSCNECQTAGSWESSRGRAAKSGEQHNRAKHPTVTERI